DVSIDRRAGARLDQRGSSPAGPRDIAIRPDVGRATGALVPDHDGLACRIDRDARIARATRIVGVDLRSRSPAGDRVELVRPGVALYCVALVPGRDRVTIGRDRNDRREGIAGIVGLYLRRGAPTRSCAVSVRPDVEVRAVGLLPHRDGVAVAVEA